MLRAALWVWALAGCDVIFRVDHVSGTADAPATDAVTADAVSVCAQVLLDDEFDDDLVCAPWGDVRTWAPWSPRQAAPSSSSLPRT
jgi:hypothetical protein